MLKNAIAKVKGFVSNNKSLVRASAVTSVVSSAALCASIFVSAADEETAITNALQAGVSNISSNVLNYISTLLPSCLTVFGMTMAIGIGVKFIKKIIK